MRSPFLSGLILILFYPFFLLYPIQNVPKLSSLSSPLNQGVVCPDLSTATFDELIAFLDAVESGALDEVASPSDLDQINEFVAFLAAQGSLPEEEVMLACDIENLLQVGSSYGDIYNYEIVPCGMKKFLKKTGKFIKKHKKEIIIGVVVVVAVTAAVVVASATGAAAAVAGSVGAAALSSEESPSDKVPNIVDIDHAAVGSILDDQISSFKKELPKEDFFSAGEPNERLLWEET